ncbi:methyltransferase [Streptomyces mayteni]
MHTEAEIAESGEETPANFFNLTTSLLDAQAMATGLELGLFTLLHSGPADSETIRTELGLQPRGVRDWLNLLVINGLLERTGEQYRNSPAADRYLVRHTATYTGDLLQRRLFPALFGFTTSLRTGAPHDGSHFMEAVAGLDVTRQFASQMDHMTEPLAPHLITTFGEWGRYRSVLDLAGCRGNMVSHLVAAHPNLTGHVLDLPIMARLFEEKAAERGVSDRMTFHPGDFFTEPFPPADVVMIGHAVIDWSREQREFLIRKAFDSVNPGGALLIYDRLVSGLADPAESVNLKISLTMLVLTRGGTSCSYEELRDHATAAGFSSVTSRRLGPFDTLVVCRKAPAT